MKKAVLLVRVSTTYQDYEDQTNDLITFAKRDGFTDNELEIIQNKESGTKLTDEERQGLTEMYASIKNPDNQIECVYVWELSRLSRNPDTLYKIKGELVKRKINLKIAVEHAENENKNPAIRYFRLVKTRKYLEQLSDREKYDIIHRHIKSVSITNCPDRKATKKIEIDTFPLDRFVRFDRSIAPIYYYSYRVKDKTKQVFKIDKRLTISYIKIEERFKRTYKKQSDK